MLISYIKSSQVTLPYLAWTGFEHFFNLRWFLNTMFLFVDLVERYIALI